MIRTIAPLLLVLTAACGDVEVTALTVAPPGKTALLDSQDNVLTLSRGIAFAFECNEHGNYYGPCRDSEATSSAPAIAAVFPGYLDSVSERPGLEGPRGRTAFVVVGLAEGTADLDVTSDSGSVGVRVTIVP